MRCALGTVRRRRAVRRQARLHEHHKVLVTQIDLLAQPSGPQRLVLRLIHHTQRIAQQSDAAPLAC